MDIQEQIKLFEKELVFEKKHCARIAAIHSNSKENILSMETKLIELYERKARTEVEATTT